MEDGERALRSLDFYVHCDLFETPSSRYADILLPVNTPWEREGLRIGFEISAEAEQLVQLRQRMVSPRGESRSDNDIVFDLAVRLGMAQAFFGGSLEAGWNHMLAPSGLTVDRLREQPGGVRVPVADVERKYAGRPRERAFNTQTGLVELYSELLLRHGYPPLPRAGQCPEEADDIARGAYPFVLTSAKSGYYCHSQHRGLPSLRRRALQPEAEIPAALAAARGIASGDAIRVTTAIGSARFTAKVRDGLHPRVVVGEFGWWQRCDALAQTALGVTGENHSNYNGLIAADSIDPVSGSVPLRAYRCNVERDPAFDVTRRRWDGYRAFRVASLVKEAREVTSVCLEPLDGGGLPDFLPGQHVTIKLTVPPAGEEIVRSYSPAHPADAGSRQLLRPSRARRRARRRLRRGRTRQRRACPGRAARPAPARLHVRPRADDDRLRQCAR
ncbi:molybdopterin dinucleotide binding domain-containing protein [Cupriavidus basilensis]|uniref:molybdopterin dinucleotide binding domain-containing protein n=1 Tax=Cupriavidus basilensis TaxID=68895 RepID=UPI000305B922|nr:molybdopterin dinucleotide binding domain-containing protein [Cupriavidus basilensis]